MSVTIRYVARRAGVSPITASHTFSGTHRVAPKTRGLVLQAAEQLGYAPDLLAQGLVRKQSPIVGVVVLELANPFFAPVIDAIHAVARDKEHMILISQSNRRPELEQASLKQFRQIRVAGVLVTPASTELEHLHYLESQGTHVVLVARRWDRGDYVAINDQLGGYLAGEHLRRIGHRRFACVALDEPHNSANQARVQGFKRALEESGGFPVKFEMDFTQAVQADAACIVPSIVREGPRAVSITADTLLPSGSDRDAG